MLNIIRYTIIVSHIKKYTTDVKIMKGEHIKDFVRFFLYSTMH